jgi:hypothetical protein
MNPLFTPDMKLADIDLSELWQAVTPVECAYAFQLDFYGELTFSVWDFETRGNYVMANGCLMIVNYTSGSCRFSTARMEWLIETSQGIYPIQTPAQAFQSWAGDTPDV